ncbi:MAG: leucyl aminopeptidase family protein [Planctomycetota bacterium]
MSRMTLATGASAALLRSDEIVLVAPLALWKGAWGEAVAALPGAAEIVRAAVSGASGPLVTLVEGKGVRRISGLVLPASAGRHLAPSRSEALYAALGGVALGRGASRSILFGLESDEHFAPLATAALRRLPSFTLKSDAPKEGAITLGALDAAGKPVRPPRSLAARLEAQRWAARLVDMPTSELDTAGFVRETKKFLRGVAGVTVKEIKGDQLLAAGLGGIHAVGRAGAVAPRLLVLEYSPKKPRRTVALVGKGVVYDTGGLSLKSKDGMPGMKSDMGGAAAVAGAFAALARNGAADRILGLVPLVENAINERAVRNDDVIRMHSGHTVEINNTDAEGRLILGDAVSWAARQRKPDLIVDAATLTGAQKVATGNAHAGIVASRGALEAAAVAAGRRCGDLVHPLPFAPEIYQLEFASQVADMKNSVADRGNAQASCAAQFIWAHVDDLAPAWLHVDLAGPAFRGGRGTGYGVALLEELTTGLRAEDLRAD